MRISFYVEDGKYNSKKGKFVIENLGEISVIRGEKRFLTELLRVIAESRKAYSLRELENAAPGYHD